MIQSPHTVWNFCAISLAINDTQTPEHKDLWYDNDDDDDDDEEHNNSDNFVMEIYIYLFMVLVSMEYAFGRVLNPLGACRIRRISKLLVHLYCFTTFFQTSALIKDDTAFELQMKKTCQSVLVVGGRLLI